MAWFNRLVEFVKWFCGVRQQKIHKYVIGNGDIRGFDRELSGDELTALKADADAGYPATLNRMPHSLSSPAVPSE